MCDPDIAGRTYLSTYRRLGARAWAETCKPKRDMTEIALHFAANLLSCWIIDRAIYQSKAKRRDYVFTFTWSRPFSFCAGCSVGPCFALGLFAIFGIIRYRTNVVPIREMTYLFLVIALAVMNALAPLSMPLLEVGAGNAALWALAFALERMLFVEHLVTKRVVYDRIELLQEGRREELKADIAQRIGEPVERIDIGDINLLRETAVVKVSYRGEDRSEHLDPNDAL